MVENEESDETRELKTRLSAAALLNASLAAVQCLQMNAIYEAVLLARRHPELYVLPGAAQTRAEGIRLAERSVVFDLALRLSKSENVIWSLLHDTETLIARLPKVWAEFRGGRVPHSNVRTAAELARSLPDDSPVFDELDALLVDRAARLTPSKFRTAARVIRERLHPVDPVERHQAAAVDRRVEIEPADDGMAWMHLYSDAPAIMKIDARLTAAASRQRAQSDESRTLAQLRADAAADLLTGRGTPNEVVTHVQISVPVTTLLNQPTLLTQAQLAPAVLDGYGPIDEATARLLVADAPSFRRIFTDPISGVDLNMDRRSYRPTAAQREWLRRKFRSCVVPHCSRASRECDLDHTTDWQFDGSTNDDNLAPLSRGHHSLKHKTKITLSRAEGGRYAWTTPTGFTRTSDPPPF